MTQDPNAITLQRIADALERLAEAADAIAALMAAGPALAAGADPQPTPEENDWNDWNDWIEWKGGPCPINANRVYQRRYRDGVIGNWTTEAGAGAGQWTHIGGAADIIAYRFPKEPK